MSFLILIIVGLNHCYHRRSQNKFLEEAKIKIILLFLDPGGRGPRYKTALLTRDFSVFFPKLFYKILGGTNASFRMPTIATYIFFIDVFYITTNSNIIF